MIVCSQCMAFFSLVLIRSHNNRYSGGGDDLHLSVETSLSTSCSLEPCVSRPLSVSSLINWSSVISYGFLQVPLSTISYNISENHEQAWSFCFIRTLITFFSDTHNSYSIIIYIHVQFVLHSI